MKKYSNIISLGFFCSVATEIERIGMRSCSYPFDWVISDFKNVVDMIENHFQNFLKEEYLQEVEEKQLPSTIVVKNIQTHTTFFHDFKKGYTIKEQLPEVVLKYNRRIQRFYKDITQQRTLFIRYIKDKEEVAYIHQNYERVLKRLKKYNAGNDIIFISNKENDELQEASIKKFLVEKDENDSVARKIFKKNRAIRRYIENCMVYKKSERMKNYLFYYKKVIKKKRKERYIAKNENFIGQ